VIVRIGAAWRTVTSGKVYLNGAWRTLTNGRAYISGVWRDVVSFAQPYTGLTITPSEPGGSSSTSDTMTSRFATATPTGGLAPFTYAWTLVSSTGLTGITINYPTSASTSVTATLTVPVGTTGYANLKCTATDALGTSKSATVTFSFVYYESPGGTA
jgi:hypothetical protein